jgi:hypothetical protein
MSSNSSRQSRSRKAAERVKVMKTLDQAEKQLREADPVSTDPADDLPRFLQVAICIDLGRAKSSVAEDDLGLFWVGRAIFRLRKDKPGSSLRGSNNLTCCKRARLSTR